MSELRIGVGVDAHAFAAGIPLVLGGVAIDHPARPNEDIKRLLEKGVTVFAVRDDLEERGLDPSNCVSGVKLIRRNDVALLLDDYNQVWHW